MTPELQKKMEANELRMSLADAPKSIRDYVEAQQSWIASLEAHARDADRMYKELETELAAAQAREKILLEALEDFKIYAQDTGQPLYIYRRITDALSTPHDDSALRERLKAERERCADLVFDMVQEERNNYCWSVLHEAQSAIRAMEDQ